MPGPGHSPGAEGPVLGCRERPTPVSLPSPWLAGVTSSARTCLWEPLGGEYWGPGPEVLLGSGLMGPTGGWEVFPEEAVWLGWCTGQPGPLSTGG